MKANVDYEILSAINEWLLHGHHVLLVTVLKTWGSSPRPVGSLMAIRDDGLHAGSVSGGCVEEDLLLRAKQNNLIDDSFTTIAYGSNAQEAHQLGLPCGGRLELLIESLEDNVQLQTLLTKMSMGELMTRRVCLNTGEISLHKATVKDKFSYQDNTVKKVFGPTWQVLLIGAGHLSQAVAQIAQMMDYTVRVCDPRDDYQQAWNIEDIDVSICMPDDFVKEFTKNHQSSQSSIVLALTHDPKLDDMALLEALSKDYFYVGALGSKANNEQRRARLKSLGISAEQLKRLHGPVGLPIGSHTPAEIAVSIMAHITALRHNKCHNKDVQSI